MKPRRVCLVVLEDFPGSENRVQRQARALLAAGWEVRIFAARGRETIRDWQGARVSRSLVSRKKSATTARRLWEYVVFPAEAAVWLLANAVMWRPEVIQVASMPDWLVFSAVPARWLTRCRVILDLHELMPELMLVRGGSDRMKRHLVRIERWCINAANTVLVPTPGCARVLSERIPLSLPHVVMNGVDPAVYPIVDPTSAGSASATTVIGFHGTLAQRFGVDTVIRAVDVIRSRGIHVRFEVYGDGIDRNRFEDLAASLRLQDTVTFHGQVPAAQLAEIVPAFDIGVAPMVDEEFTRIAYSTKVFEYVASGVAVVASDVESTRELFSPEALSYVTAGDVDGWADGIIDLVVSRDERLRRARRAQIELRGYVWDVLSPSYIRLVAGG